MDSNYRNPLPKCEFNADYFQLIWTLVYDFLLKFKSVLEPFKRPSWKYKKRIVYVAARAIFLVERGLPLVGLVYSLKF
jgi:hypothetical protein